MLIAVAVAAMAFGISASSPARCSISTLRHNPEGYIWPLENISTFVTDAEVIVRARAVGTFPGSNLQPVLSATDSSVVFEVQEMLKGDGPLGELSIPGVTSDRNDFNSGQVPYRIVRSEGQRGDCFAMTYRIGAEYLLLLKSREGVLHPYWAGLAPLNEQITGRDDPWVEWVRKRAGLGN